MAKNNDERILELKKQIQEKKEKLGKSSRFNPITNCSIEIDGVRYNIQVLTKEQLTMLMIKLNSYLMSAKVLDVAEDFNISGYHCSDWIEDIQSKIDIHSRKDEERKLKDMEEKLVKLLTDGKKVELEIDEIESLLKG